MKLFLKLTIFFLFYINSAYADLIKPNINLKPFDVLKIQLNSLNERK